MGKIERSPGFMGDDSRAFGIYISYDPGKVNLIKFPGLFWYIGCRVMQTHKRRQVIVFYFGNHFAMPSLAKFIDHYPIVTDDLFYFLCSV